MTQVCNIRDCSEGWEDDPSYAYIGRAGHGHDGYFGNAFKGLPREESIRRYEQYFRWRLDFDEDFHQRVMDLKGKLLVCFCAPLPCHGDVIAQYVDHQGG